MAQVMLFDGTKPLPEPVLTCSQGPVSIPEKTSYRKISRSLEAARFVFRFVRSLWNLTGTSAAVLPMCLSNFKAIRQFKVPISWLRDFTRSYEKTSFRILRRGPELFHGIHLGAIAQTVLMNVIHNMWSEITRLRSLSHLSRSNE